MLRRIPKPSPSLNNYKSMLLRCLSGSGESGDTSDLYNHATFLTGGLDKFQGGLKEEKYFLEKNSKLINKIKERENANMERIPEIDLNASSLTMSREMACAPCKHKNYREETYFFNDQIDCTKRLCKRLHDEENLAENTTDKGIIENDEV